MSDPIGVPALSSSEDNPGYDLISLGLVVLVILLAAVWLTHYWRQPPPGLDEYNRVRSRVDLGSSAGHLELARWCDFNLKPAQGDHLSLEFKDHLAEALKKKPAEAARDWARDWYLRRAGFLEAKDRQAFNVAAHVELMQLCAEVGLLEEAAREREKVKRARPDHPALREK